VSLTDLLTGEHLHHVLHTWGYGAVALAVGLEAVGLPLPGEITLVSAALYAGATHHMDINLVVLTSAAAAVMGSNLGYLIGRALGEPLLQRYGSRIGLTEPRLLMGRRLFAKHGAKVVLFGRFIVVLRTIAASLAGALEMPFPVFLAANAAGGVIWSCLYGFGAYMLGNRIEMMKGPIGIGLGALAALGFVATVLVARHHEKRLTGQASAEHKAQMAPEKEPEKARV
jgi:membrane protein DedA with SNARE-associated domain